MTRKKRVAIIFGGRSGEHEVSVMSARSVFQALDKDRFEPVMIGIAKDGNWLEIPDPGPVFERGQLRGDEGVAALIAGIPGTGEAPVAQTGETGDRAALKSEEGSPIDIVFPVLHGPYGEDGTVQGLLELGGLPYVGAGVAASSVGMDKELMKKVFLAEGLPLGDFQAVLRKGWEAQPQQVLDEIEERFGYPCFVKPVNLGSSVGISKAKDRDGLTRAFDLAAQYDRKILVEEFIKGREIECSVLGNDNPRASVPGEIIPSNEFYDYNAKYVDDTSDLVIPAPLPQAVINRVQELSVRAFKAVDCAGMARVDFFYVEDEDRVVLNEINTIPGFTKISMYPKLWEASGVGYTELISRLLDLAVERFEDKGRSKTTYE